MSIRPSNTESNYLDATATFPEDPKELVRELNILYRKIATAVNDREIGKYDALDQGVVVPPGFERLTGQIWPGANNQIKKPGFRKVVKFPALAVGVNVQPHNIGSLINFEFTKLGGCLQNQAAGTFAACPNGDGGANRSVALDVIGVNVQITLPAASPYVGFTATVVLEYLKS